MLRTMIIYLVTNTVNGKQYVGQTTRTIVWRWRGHLSCARRGSMLPLHCAIRKYGSQAFSVTIVQKCSTQVELDSAEVHWISELRTTKTGYNLAEGGVNSRILRGKNHPHFGKHLTDEHRAKLSIAHTGKTMSEAARQQMSRSQRGRKHSAESRAKISLGLMGRPCGETTRRKIGQRTSRSIRQLSPDGQFIKEWQSITEAASTLGYARTNLVKALKCQKPYHGFMWMYVVYDPGHGTKA